MYPDPQNPQSDGLDPKTKCLKAIVLGTLEVQILDEFLSLQSSSLCQRAGTEGQLFSRDVTCASFACEPELVYSVASISTAAIFQFSFGIRCLKYIPQHNVNTMIKASMQFLFGLRSP